MKDENLEKILEKSFRTEPEYILPADFAQNVTLKIIRKTQWLTDLYEYLYLIAIVVLLLGAATGTYYLVNKEVLMQIFNFISENVVQFAGIVLILNFILFADRVLLRLFFSRWN
jgi:hypothetical protein